MAKILSTSVSFGRHVVSPVEKARELGHELHFLKYDPVTGKKDLLEAVGDADALIVGTEPVDHHVFERAKNLKVVAKHGIGVDNIDLDEAERHNVQVVNAPGTNATAVAEYTWALILDLMKKTPQAISEAKAGGWRKQIGLELSGKRLGIIGLGQIGKKVAVIGRGFGMTVAAFDPWFDIAFGEAHGVASEGLDCLLGNSDVLTIHTALNDSTYGLFDKARLAMMKPSSFLINVARGGIVDEAALYQALTEGVIAGAACDVFEKEPPAPDNPLLGLGNFLPTTHTAGYTFESLERMGLMTVESIHAVLNGEAVPNRVV